MPTISIKRTHELDHRTAQAAAKKIAKDLNKRFDLVTEWEGDNASFERPGVSGVMRVGKTDVELEVKLSFLMAPLKSSIEQAIRKELDSTFGKTKA